MMNISFPDLLKKYIPENTLEYCCSLRAEHHFDFIVTKKRETKLGDYRYEVNKKKHTITINQDLNPFSFLITYVHEVAHHRTTIKHGHKKKPHGKEWKEQFQELTLPLISMGVFPEKVEFALIKYISNPKASSCSDLDLLRALGNYDDNRDLKYLSEVNPWETFKLNKRIFMKESVNRTRALCKDVKTGKKYFVSEGALVELLQKSLFQ
jgi:SprT protein